MGKLVKFDQRRKPMAAAAKPPGSAQIIMFTGVRYERSTAPATTLDPSRPKRKRG